MLYGLLSRNYGHWADRIVGFNIGDPIQDYALELLYKRMGINDSQIVRLRPEDLRAYSGEYVLLPMVGIALSDDGYGELPLSPNIIPVFISSHFIKTDFDNGLIEYLRHFEPIGCRDEFGMVALRRKGLLCTLTGCITVTLPRRPANQTAAKKVFIVDVPEHLVSKIPHSIREKAEMATHLPPCEDLPPNTDEAGEWWSQYSIRQIQRYRDEASLVISSRLHAIVPCIAMGIPVIALMDNISQRFSWLDRLVPLYDERNADSIDWNPVPVDIETEKEAIAQLFMDSIRNAYDKWSNRADVSWFYENRTRSNYGSKYIAAVSSIARDNPAFEYAVWGCGLIGETTYQAICREYPKARLIAAYDKFVEGDFHGQPIMRPSSLSNRGDAILLITSYSAKQEAYDTMSRLGLVEGRDFLFLGSLNG